RVKHLCLTARTLVSVTAKDCSCQNRGREAGVKGSFPFCPTAVKRCMQEISARQDAAPQIAANRFP
ncbi:hypothetical protein ACMYZ5_09990, partial [Bacteroides sp. KG68]|uniref:hypothetical protein n=1 Tax=Bacteroides sp. KG68 TaxID=3397824 RepID=UPI003D99B263